MKVYYKIVEERTIGTFCFLHHGINGSKKIPLNKWISADIKENIRDGSGNRRYTSGIHIIDGMENVINYRNRFKSSKNYTIVKCYARGLRKKEHSKNYVLLANSIKVID